MRRILAIKEDSLTRSTKSASFAQSMQRLCDPWVIEDLSVMESACVAWPRGRVNRDRENDAPISPAEQLRSVPETSGGAATLGRSLGQVEIQQIIADLSAV